MKNLGHNYYDLNVVTSHKTAADPKYPWMDCREPGRKEGRVWQRLTAFSLGPLFNVDVPRLGRVFLMRHLRPREGERFAQGHAARKTRSQMQNFRG